MWAQIYVFFLSNKTLNNFSSYENCNFIGLVHKKKRYTDLKCGLCADLKANCGGRNRGVESGVRAAFYPSVGRQKKTGVMPDGAAMAFA